MGIQLPWQRDQTLVSTPHAWRLGVGAVVRVYFVGYVRDFNEGRDVAGCSWNTTRA